MDAAVDGSVMRVGQRVRISARLVRAKSGEHIWAEDYEDDLSEILTLQSKVARSIAHEIQVKVTPQEEARLVKSAPVNTKSYLAYWKGRHYWNRRTGEGLEKGMEYFQQAIRKDPGYALAYSGIADAYALAGSLPYDAMRWLSFRRLLAS